jgi:hypothetical protein
LRTEEHLYKEDSDNIQISHTGVNRLQSNEHIRKYLTHSLRFDIRMLLGIFGTVRFFFSTDTSALVLFGVEARFFVPLSGLGLNDSNSRLVAEIDTKSIKYKYEVILV